MGFQIYHSDRFRVHMIAKGSNHHSDIGDDGQGQIVLKSVLRIVLCSEEVGIDQESIQISSTPYPRRLTGK